jgi:hypothetical protein
MVNDYQIALSLLRQGSPDLMRKTFAKDIPEVIDILEQKIREVENLQDTISYLEAELEAFEE